MNYNELKNFKKKLKKNNIFILYEKNNILLNKYKIKIKKFFLKKKFFKIYKIKINQEKDWKIFFYKTKKLDFFNKNKLFFLKILSKNIKNKILKILFFMKQNKNFIIIIQIKNFLLFKKLQKKLYKIFIFVEFKKINKIFIIQELKQKFLNYGISIKAINYIFKISNNQTHIFYSIKKILSLTFPKKKIKKKHVKKIFSSKNKFYYPWQWINSLMFGNHQESIKIINFFQKNKFSSLYLVRYLEKEILIVILIKKKLKNEYKKYFFKYPWKKKMYLRSSINNTILKYYKIVKILYKIEISLAKNKEKYIWMKLKTISFILK